MLFAPEKARHPGLPRKPAARAANLLSAPETGRRSGKNAPKKILRPAVPRDKNCGRMGNMVYFPHNIDAQSAMR